VIESEVRMAMGRRVVIPLVAAVGAVAIAAGVVVAVVAASPSGSMRTVTFTAAEGDVPNPERGFYDRLDTVLTERDFSREKADGITLVHSYVQLDAFRDQPIDQATLDQLDAGLAAVRAAGLKIVLRFAYNQGPSTGGGADAPESIVLEHIGQLAPVLARNDDVIASVEAGFIGQWGEWHDSTNGLTDPAAQRTILAAILKAVPSNRDVELRYPSDIRALEPRTGDATVPDGSDASRIGNHQDCFLSSSPDDTGTWDRDGHSPAQDKKLIAGVGRHAMVGGETCNPDPPARTNCTTALRELTQMGFSYLNRDFEPNSLAKLKREGCSDDISQRLGYRLALTSATVPTTLRAGDTSVTVGATIRNTGFASVINERPVYAVVRSGSKVWTERIRSDPRGWNPGTSTTVRAKVRIPGGLPAGAVSIELWMPDAASSLRDRSAYSIRFANTGTWDAATGSNVLDRTSAR
jgi:hypothetical protein